LRACETRDLGRALTILSAHLAPRAHD
jgi:hypothetical protein